MVCKTTVIVMEAKVGRTDLTDTKLLLLKTDAGMEFLWFPGEQEKSDPSEVNSNATVPSTLK